MIGASCVPTLGVGAHEVGQPCHEYGHPLGGGDDLVVLGGPLADRLVQVVGRHLPSPQRVRTPAILYTENFVTAKGSFAAHALEYSEQN